MRVSPCFSEVVCGMREIAPRHGDIEEIFGSGRISSCFIDHRDPNDEGRRPA